MQTTDVLLVGNSHDSATQLREAISWCGQSQSSIHIAIGGREALRFLRCEGGFANKRRPGLIVVSGPLKSGFSTRQLISVIRRDLQLSSIPLLIMTGDCASDGLGCGRLIERPIGTKKLNDAAFAIHNQWLNTPVPVSDSADRMDGVRP